MFSRNAFTRRLFVLFAASGGVVIASCGNHEEAFGKRYPVSGTVTYNGQPLEKGAISFVPDKGAGATGAIEKGSYRLSTGGEGDGALPGKYKVTVTAKEDSYEIAKADFLKDSKGKGADVSFVPRQYLSAAAEKAKSLIPTGYGDIRTTTLTAEVKEQSNSIDFKLSDADAPPEPPKTPAKGGVRRRP
jgi:hypothetical protein